MATQFDSYHVWLGIPPTEQPPNCYRLLGIALFEANPDVISSAADRQMAHLRSFQTGKHSVESQELLNQVAKAKVRLLRANTKAAYDAQLRNALTPDPSPEMGEGSMRRVSLSVSDAVKPKQIGVSPAQAQAAKSPMRTARRLQPAALAMELDFTSVDLASRRSRRKNTSSSAVGWIAAIGIPAAIAAGVALWIMGQRQPADQSVAQVIPAESRKTPATIASQPAAPVARPKPAPPAAPAPEKLLSLARDREPKPAPTVSSVEPPAVEEPLTETREADNTLSPEIPVFVAPEDTTSDMPEALEFDESELPEADMTESGFQAERGEEEEEDADEQEEATPPATASRLPIPDEQAQAAIRKQLDSMYETDDQQTPRARLKLAHDLMEVASESQDSAEQYVLLQTAAELAGKAGDALLMLEAIEACEQKFKFDGSQVREAAILRFADSANTSERIRALTSIAHRAVEQAIQQNQCESALNMANAVARATQRPSGKEFRKQATELRNLVKTVSQEQQQLAAAEVALRADPGNESANKTLGAWHCFVGNDWKRGLPLLAKGADAEIRQVAEQDLGLSEAAANEDRLAVAEAWWSLAESRKGEEHDALQLRAAYWYQQCLGESLSGLAKLKIEKRLEEAAAARVRHQEWVAKRTLKSDKPASELWSDG